MIIDAFTVTQTDDKIIAQIDRAWLDKWPMTGIFGQPVKLPAGCRVVVNQANIEFIRD